MIETVRYRAYLFKRPVGPWREKEAHAMDDAFVAGGASFGSEPWESDRLYLGPGAAIVRETHRNGVLYLRTIF